MAKKSAKKNLWGSPKKRDQYTVVVEDLLSSFKAFGENLSFVREDTKKLREQSDIHGAELSVVKIAALTLQQQMKEFDVRLAKLEVRVAQLEQANLELLKEIREDKVGEEVKALKLRVEALEAKVRA